MKNPASKLSIHAETPIEKMATTPSKLINTTTASTSAASAASSSSTASSAPSFSSVSASASSSAAVAGDFCFLGGAGSSALRAPFGGFRTPVGEVRKRLVANLILDLADNNRREDALARLSVMREAFNDLAPLLWYSFGTIAILLQEIVSVYPMLSPPTLTLIQSNRVSNALALLQCVASHPETRTHFIKACIPLYLYTLLDTTCETRPFEYMRLTSLGVIGALVKVPNTEVILFLLSSEIMPLCLRSMENGSELSRTVATFILQRILLDDVGLEYVCSLPERLFAVNQALGNVIAALVDQPSARLLKHVLRCYLRFSEDERSLWALRCTLPKWLTDGTFNRCLWEDQTARMWLQQFLDNIQGPPVVQGTVTNNLMRMLLCAM